MKTFFLKIKNIEELKIPKVTLELVFVVATVGVWLALWLVQIIRSVGG